LSKETPELPREAPPPSGELAAKSSDVVLIHGVTPDGQGLEVLRKRNERLEMGALRPVRQGAPIHGELVKVKPRPEFPLLCDIETELPKPAALADVAGRTEETPIHKGPAQVASDNYRKNWDLIWNRPNKDSERLN
jgi:hypothetical protein